MEYIKTYLCSTYNSLTMAQTVREEPFKEVHAREIGYDGWDGRGLPADFAYRICAKWSSMGGLPGDRKYSYTPVHEAQPVRSPSGTAVDSLTDKERATMALRAQGLTAKEIARLTGATIKTVESHCHNAQTKMQAKNGYQAVALFVVHTKMPLQLIAQGES